MPEAHPSDRFEVSGYYVEYLTFDSYSYIGYKLVPDQGDRLLGYAGRELIKIEAPITLTKGTNQVTYKASVKKPLIVYTMLQAVCGSMKSKVF